MLVASGMEVVSDTGTSDVGEGSTGPPARMSAASLGVWHSNRTIAVRLPGSAKQFVPEGQVNRFFQFPEASHLNMPPSIQAT